MDAPLPDLRRTGIDPNHWYPVARSRSVRRRKTLGVSFAGAGIVIVRTKSGAVFALENRCAHRQVPLSNGVVQGEELKCCYHGWTYSSSGRCVNVPYLDAGDRLPNGVRSYPCREAYGLIFVFPGDVARLNDAIFPDLPGFEDRRYKTRYLDREIGCHYTFMHENLIDMNHQFLHRRLMGSVSAQVLDLREAPGRVEVDYTFERSKGDQHIGERFILGRKAKPAGDGPRDVMTIATDYPYQTLRFFTAGGEEPVLDLWNAYVPVDREQTVNHQYGLMMIRKPGIPGLIHLMWPFISWFTDGIFAEDRWIVELEQKAHDQQGEDWNQEIFPVVQALRRLLLERGVPLSRPERFRSLPVRCPAERSQ